jgi:hypothetical protein
MNIWSNLSGTSVLYARVLLVGYAAVQMVYNLILPVYGDEAYYWVWSKNLQLGYFDHPPMVAYVNALFCTVFGDTLFAVRLATVSCLSGAAVFIYALTARVFTAHSALLALLLFLLTPTANLGFSLHTIDSPLILFWSMALYYGYKAIFGGSRRAYLLTGVGLGAALLSKYTAVLFVGFLGLFLLLTKPRTLLRPHVWMALGVALLLFSPVLVNNFQHGFASFMHQYTHGSATELAIRLDTFGDFFLGQFVVVSPVFMGLLIVTSLKCRCWWSDVQRRYLMLSFLFPLVFFLYKALFKRMELNSISEVSHWFSQCDLNSFERSGSRVFLGWLDEPTGGELHVECLSEPDAFPLGLQVSRGVRAQTATQSPIWAHPPSAWSDLSRTGPAEGVPDHRRSFDARSCPHVH